MNRLTFRLLTISLTLACAITPALAQRSARAQLRDDTNNLKHMLEEEIRLRDQVINELRRDLMVKERRYLLPDKEDYAKYPGYGIVRFLAPGVYPKPLDDWHDSSSLSFNAGDIFFSGRGVTFRPKVLGYGNGQFVSVFPGADVAFIVDLGNVPIDSVGKNRTELRPVITYRPPDDPKLMKEELERLRTSERPEDRIFRSHAQAVVDHSYFLRTVSTEGLDLMMSFRVVREDDDKSLIVIYRILQTTWDPHLREIYRARNTADPCDPNPPRVLPRR